MKIFGHPVSTCTRKVLMTLNEKNAAFEFVPVDVMAGAHKKPEHLARQPFGQIPALQDGDFKLFESRAICRYLDQVLPGAPLAPNDPKGRALMEQWMSVESSNFTPHAMALIYQYVFVPMRGGKTDQAKVDEARPKLAACAEILDKHLARGPHMLGESFTLADVCYMPYVDYVVQTPARGALLDYANLAAWWNRVSGRDAWKKTLAQKV